MSASTFKGGLAVGGSAFDKSKLQMRRPTPDSDVLASSDEDRDHVPPARSVNTAYPAGRRPSSGWLQDIQPNRKYSLPSVSFAGSQPTTPSLELPQQTRPTTSSFPWNTSSFTSNSASTRLKEVLPSPTSAYATGERPLPSPTTTPEGEETIGFLLNQSNSVRKAVRSQSYSVGQSETDASPAQASNRLRSSLRHRPSKPSLLGESAAGLGQLREDDIYEMDSNTVDAEQGVRLPMNYWEREQRDLKHQALLKQAAEQSARRNRATSSGSPVAPHPRRTPQSNRNVPQSDYAVEEHEDNDRFSEATKSSLTRRFSEHVGSIGRDIGADTMGASVSQDWMGNVPAFTPDALGRRHSFAHYTSHTSTFQLPTLGNTQEEDEEEELSPLQTSESPGPPENFDHNAYFSGYGPASRALNASSISAAHPDPILSNVPSATPNPYTVPSTLGRPGRRIYVVAFKCSRADIFYTYDNTGLEIRRGDLVVCEGDRGVDLGQVTHADVSLDDAKKYKAQALEEHFRWLVMFSQYSVAGTGNSNPMLGSLARANGVPNNAQRAQLTGMGAQQDPDAKPKMIKRLAQQHEIYGLRDKEGQEAKAKRLAVTKTADHGFPMEILDAEFQADNHKITFFYYAEHYVNFNPLVADLFKHYKIRIWMSAVNPASVVNPAGLMQVPPPSAIGPGAILHSSNSNASLSVGPGFGNPYRSNEQRGRGRGQNVQQGNLDETFFPFANQVPLISSQQAYPMPQWGHAQAMGPDMYGRFGGSPMNYGAWYPPTTFSASPAFNNASSNASYRGGYPASTSAPTTFPGVGPNLSGIYGQYLAAQYNAYGSGNNAGHGNQGNARQQSGHGTPAGHSATPGSSSTATPAASSALNGDLAAALADMALNK